MGQRRQARELALQFLYQLDFWGKTPRLETLERDWANFCRHFQVIESVSPYARSLVEGVSRHGEEIDCLLRSHSRHWRLERMTLVDRNILRLAAYELRFGREAPEKVAINEALEIAKRFGTEESAPFINGILDAIRQDGLQPEPAAAC